LSIISVSEKLANISEQNYYFILFGSGLSRLGYSMSKPTLSNPLEKLLAESGHLERDSLYTEALKILDQIFQEGPDNPIIYPAICSVGRIFNRIGAKRDLLKKLDDLYFKYQNYLVGLAARDYSVTVLAKQRNFKEALNRSREVVAQYIDKEGLEENAAWALYEQGLINLELENQNDRIGKTLVISSTNAFGTILEKFPDSEAAEDEREQFPDLPPITDDTVFPEKYQLLSAYPNPFNPMTTISYMIPEDSHVEISIFDISGRLVETLINQKQNAGQYDVRWNAYSYPSGVHLYQIQLWDFQQVGKCLLVK
jgi:tetratricopeptide (TPR) repeat protein